MRWSVLLLPALVALWAVWPARGDAPSPAPSPVRTSPWALAAGRDGRVLYAACGPTGTVAVIDVAGRRLTRTIPVGGTPRSWRVSADDRILAVSLERQDEVVLFDLPSCDERARVAVGADPEGLAFTADGRRLYVANRLSQDVSIVDVGRGAEIRRVGAGREPFALSRAPDGKTIAVVSRRADLAPATEPPRTEVTLLDAPTGDVQRRIHLPVLPSLRSGGLDARLAHPACARDTRAQPPAHPAGRARVGALRSTGRRRRRGRNGPRAAARGSQPWLRRPGRPRRVPDVERAFVAAGGNDEVGLIDLAALLREGVEGDLGRTWRHLRGARRASATTRAGWRGSGTASSTRRSPSRTASTTP